MNIRHYWLASATLALVALSQAPLLQAQEGVRAARIGADSAAACDYSSIPGVVWWGTQRQMSFQQLVSYVAPVYWFSPDEPLLEGTSGAEIRMPAALPFQDAPDAPVVYYQVKEVITFPGMEEEAVTRDTIDPGASMIDLETAVLIRLGYYGYYPFEAGLGAHQHDLEAVEFKMAIARSDGEWMLEKTSIRCDEKMYIAFVTRVTGEAHGITWFFNVLDVDAWTVFPFHLFVEEGKHATGTDKNADGYFSPGYDVNERVNDAWGVRDVIATGYVFSGGYQAWMTKPRRPEYRVWPPLPDDSPLIPFVAEELEQEGDDFAVYELRPLPPPELGAYDHHLHRFMEDKWVPDGPEMGERSDFEGFANWVDEGTAIRSIGISLLYDGDLGFSWSFPFFIVRNLEDPFTGGWIVWRMYLKDKNLRDFGWQILYTPSASRWIDSYFAAGVEWDVADCRDTNLGLDVELPPNLATLPSGCPVNPAPGTTRSKAFFTLETGLKFRVNLGESGIKPLLWFTDFWGVSFGVRNRGFPNINDLTYVIQFGAGVW